MTASIDSGGILLLVGIAIAWFGAQIVLTRLVRSYRRDLRDGIEFMRNNNDLTAAESEVLDHLISTSMAIRSSAFLSLAYLTGLIMPTNAILRERRRAAAEAPVLFKDSKFDDIMSWYFVSIFVANPLFGFTALILRVLWRLRVGVIERAGGQSSHLFALPSLEASQRI